MALICGFPPIQAAALSVMAQSGAEEASRLHTELAQATCWLAQ